MTSEAAPEPPVAIAENGDNDPMQVDGDDGSNKEAPKVDQVEDIEMVDSDDDDDEEGDDDDAKPKGDPEILLVKAQSLKDEGNTFFTEEKDYEKASRSYRRGVNAIKGLNKANSGDEQVKTMLLSLQNNLSMMQFKLAKYKQSENVANNALQIDPANCKALYRRAAARRKVGNPEGALDDLKKALLTEPNNKLVRKELLALKKELEEAKKSQKASLRKAFSKPGRGLTLYDDKVEEEKRQAELARRKKKEEEEAIQKRKQEWEDECVHRMAKGEDAVSFEDWEKERLAKIQKEKDEAEKERKEEEKRRKAAQKKAREEAKKNNGGDGDDDSDMELTESELAQMRGYKKTKDGRVTSYFTREQSLEEKSLLADIAPKKLETSPQPLNKGGEFQDITPSSSTEANVTPGKGSGSAWNHAGTW